MEFQLLSRHEFIPTNARNKVFLHIDMWNDYSFVTMFYMDYIDKIGEVHKIGNIKIGFKGQTPSIKTFEQIQTVFNGKNFISLYDDFFSIGTDMEYYKNLYSLGKETQNEILYALNDLARKPNLIKSIKEEAVFSISLLRGVRLTSITEQFARIISGNPALTEFKFSFVIPESDTNSLVKLDFEVEPSSKPSTNIHAIIGRNGGW